MRILWATAALAALAACAPTVPDSGVGFGDYESYEAERQAREAALRNSQAQIAPATPSTPVISAEELSAAGLPSSGTAEAATPAVATATAAADVNNPSISDEQDFQAVSSRETIESDRERLEQNAANYTVIQPTAVPERPGDTGPNLAAYALSTTNAVGQQLYRRTGSVERSQRACAAFASPDLAQIAFLENGGPQRDSRNLDPDGDGFACYWDPTPFRLAAR